jgi:hypothetical protein
LGCWFTATDMRMVVRRLALLGTVSSIVIKNCFIKAADTGHGVSARSPVVPSSCRPYACLCFRIFLMNMLCFITEYNDVSF